MIKLISVLNKANLNCVFCIFFSLACFNVNSLEIKNENSPGARWGHLFIYYPNQKHILLFGGTRQKGGKFLNDTWIWDGQSWKNIKTQGPSHRGFSAYTYHEERKTIIMHGGRGNGGLTYSDMWEWNGEYWSQIEAISLYKADHHQLVYVSHLNSLFAFGGWNGKNVMGDTLVWNKTWKKLSIKSPPKRASFSMVNNKKNKSVVLYGGLWINGQYADMWQWSDNDWLSISGPYDHSSLDHHSMIYDLNLETIVGFGGKNYRYQFQNKTFSLENGEISIIDSDGPSARHSFGFTFNSKDNAGYLYGGKEHIEGSQKALSDFWKWDEKSWSKIE